MTSSLAADGQVAVVDIENVSMAYRQYSKPADMVKEALFGTVHHDTFWALRDVSLKVHEGDRIGILGPNGAGKSTLLQIISGNLTPTTGRVRVQGRISSLLSLVPAWNVLDSGIENIKFNLLLQGISPQRIPELTENIVDFTELGSFIHRPVKTYSTGMSARLLFAIATSVDPEILVIDEVLGTGDGYFAAKASARMLEFCSRGRVLIFVSHALAAIHQFCNSAIWLENGEVRMRGSVDKVASAYETDVRRAEDETMRVGNRERANKRRERISENRRLSSDRVYFRISHAEGLDFTAQHLVEALLMRIGEGQPFAFPILADNTSIEPDGPQFERIESQWQRVQTIRNITGRMISHRPGRDHGAEFSIPRGVFDAEKCFAVHLRHCSTAPEPLAIDVLDPARAVWTRLEDCTRDIDGRVQTLTCSGLVPADTFLTDTIASANSAFATPIIASGGESIGPDAKAASGHVATKPKAFDGNKLRIKAIGRATLDHNDNQDDQPAEVGGPEIRGSRDAEVVGVDILVDGELVTHVRERSPFQVRIRVRLLRQVPKADIALYLTRQDGVHAFWQSSGLDGHNLQNPLGVYDVVFDFRPNCLGAGTYYLTICVANGWDYAGNWPYSEVFVRKRNAAMLTIYEELPIVNFGVANYRVPVIVNAINEISVNAVNEQK